MTNLEFNYDKNSAETVSRPAVCYTSEGYSIKLEDILDRINRIFAITGGAPVLLNLIHVDLFLSLHPV